MARFNAGFESISAVGWAVRRIWRNFILNSFPPERSSIWPLRFCASSIDVARRFSSNQLRVSIGQNIYLPWVREEGLVDLHRTLKRIELGDSGVDTVADVTTCPGSDTCRLGIASAKGLGSAISDAFEDNLAAYRELARSLKIKISGCPNGCAQHTVANIGFHAAALSHDGRTVPAHLLSLGGQTTPASAQIAHLIGKFPAKNCIKVIETLLRLYKEERLA